MALAAIDPIILDWLTSMGIDYANLTRVVIVLDAKEPVKVHVERLGDERIFHEIPESLRECIVDSATRSMKAENAENPLKGFNEDAVAR